MAVNVTSEVELSRAARKAWLGEFGGFLAKSRGKAKDAGSKPVMILTKAEILVISVES